MKHLILALIVLGIVGCQEEGKTVQRTLQAAETPESGQIKDNLNITEDSTPTPN